MDENLKKRIIEAQQGNKEVLNELVIENRGIIINISKRFENRGLEFDDIYQIGAIGFIKAVQKFDFSYNVMLSTFAVSYIIGEIKRFLRDNGPIKISRSIKALATKIEAEKKINPEITVEELARKLKIDKEEIALAMESSNCIKSLEEKISGDDSDDLSLMDRISNKDGVEDRVVNSLALKQCLDNLTNREKKIIYLRYYKNQTQKKVADIIGISQVQVSRIEKKILENLGKELKEA